MRLQERAARLAKSNPCSAYVGENTSRPASWVRLQLCKLCAAQLVKSNPCSAVEFSRLWRGNYAHSRVQLPMRTSPHRDRGGCKPPFKREPSEAVSESQNLKRESKSLILPLELTQRADFAPRAYAALSRLPQKARRWRAFCGVILQRSPAPNHQSR